MSFLGTDLNSAYGMDMMDMNAPVSPRENGNAGGLYAQPRDLLPKPMDAQPASVPQQRAPVYDASVPPQYPVSQKQTLVMPPPSPLPQQEMATQPQVNVAQLQKELAYYRQQNAGGRSSSATGAGSASPSFFDQLWSKRREVVKMVTISMIILLAISSHTVLDHYMKDWIQSSDFTFNQELMARASYPLAVLATLWFVKAFYR